MAKPKKVERLAQDVRIAGDQVVRTVVDQVQELDDADDVLDAGTYILGADHADIKKLKSLIKELEAAIEET